MLIRFKVYCPTRWGQQVYIVVGESKYLLKTTDGLYWTGEIELAYETLLSYNYEIHEGDLAIVEFGGKRSLSLDCDKITLISDTWRSPDSLDNVLYTAPFTKSIFRRQKQKKSSVLSGNTQFILRAVNIPIDYQVGLLGNHEALGAWNETRVVLLDDQSFPQWSTRIDLPGNEHIEYKYLLCDKKGKLVQWEEGENRVFSSGENHPDQEIIQDEYLRIHKDLWRGAGVALPVFSLRTHQSAGVGEFSDIPRMIDWMETVGFKVFQVLPVNDTVASHTWWDSYPYAAISVHALHPMYANMEKIGPLKDKKKWKEITQQAVVLNQKKEIDYEAVTKLKSAFFKYSYDENKDAFIKSKQLKGFLQVNKNWIFDYAVFSCLRDRYHTPDFTCWGAHQSMTDEEIAKFTSPDNSDYDDIAVHYYIQYHLDLQLKEASAYARKHGVVLKGDIPIGIFRHSVDAWRKPHLFHLDQQAGAPPDMFSTTGQNWGFPTYNWPVMASNDYAWWKERLLKMGDYFDIIRLDHILGFFRIWQMPADQIQGLLGTFYPALPLSVWEIREWGIDLDIEKYCDPQINDHILADLANHLFVEKHFLVLKNGQRQFRDELKSQHAIDEEIRKLVTQGEIEPDIYNALRREIFRLHSEVLFIRDEKDSFYHPRIDMHHTEVFKRLDHHTRHKLKTLHDHYFYHRHNQFWKENAARKLPVLRDASDMLVCGEDLGMVPDSVVPLMNELQILQLNVQRHPEYDTQFRDLHYLSVKGSGNHDMPTLRQWWEEEPDTSKRVYENVLKLLGDPPKHLTLEVADALLKKQFESNSMWVIIPLQDLMTVSNSLVRTEMNEERINVPENPHNAWCYRFHLDMEELKEATEFTKKLNSLLKDCKRI